MLEPTTFLFGMLTANHESVKPFDLNSASLLDKLDKGKLISHNCLVVWSMADKYSTSVHCRCDLMSQELS